MHGKGVCGRDREGEGSRRESQRSRDIAFPLFSIIRSFAQHLSRQFCFSPSPLAHNSAPFYSKADNSCYLQCLSFCSLFSLSLPLSQAFIPHSDCHLAKSGGSFSFFISFDLSLTLHRVGHSLLEIISWLHFPVAQLPSLSGSLPEPSSLFPMLVPIPFLLLSGVL